MRDIYIAEMPTVTGVLWVAGDEDRIVQVSWERLCGLPHEGRLDWFLDQLDAYLLQNTHEFPGSLGMQDGQPVWSRRPLPWKPRNFRERTLEALEEIPYGQTRTYGEIAAAIGNPKAARAVGNACASNPLAVVVPCHRVLGQGSLGGYTGGLDKKFYLLGIESQGMS